MNVSQLMSDEEDNKFFSKITLDYSPTIFGEPMPLLKVGFKSLPQPLLALVDSGATSSMLNPTIADALKLKINYNTKKLGTGAGGTFEYVHSEPVEVEILGQKYMVGFNIMLDNNFAWTCILGHNSIFKFAKIVFKSYKKQFDIFLRKDIN